MHLRQPGFTYISCAPFTKNNKKKQKKRREKETGDSRSIYQNKLDKVCFQHDMACGNFKELNRRAAADKYYVIKHLILLKIRNMIDVNVDLSQWFINSLIKKIQVVLLKKNDAK